MTAADFHRLNDTLRALRARFAAAYPDGYAYECDRPREGADLGRYMLDLIGYYAAALDRARGDR